MASAMKRDRCGALYEQPVCNRMINIFIDRHPYGDEKIDLCDNCYKELGRFLNEKGKTE